MSIDRTSLDRAVEELQPVLVGIAEQARVEGIRDLRASALLKAKNGVVSLAEINRVTKD